MCVYVLYTKIEDRTSEDDSTRLERCVILAPSIDHFPAVKPFAHLNSPLLVCRMYDGMRTMLDSALQDPRALSPQSLFA